MLSWADRKSKDAMADPGFFLMALKYSEGQKIFEGWGVPPWISH